MRVRTGERTSGCGGWREPRGRGRSGRRISRRQRWTRRRAAGAKGSVGFAVDYGLGVRVGKRVFGADFRRAVRNSRSVVWEAERFAALWRVRSGGGVAGVELSGETISGVGAGSGGGGERIGGLRRML